MDTISPYTLRRYDAARDAALWDEFVARSRNSTFLFRRSYMDYHSDRFPDHSLIVRRGKRTVAMLPACECEPGILSSHAGLTYGGWLLSPFHIDGAGLLGLFDAWIDYCRTVGFSRIVYKPLPDIYATVPSQEDRYALWRTGFRQESVLLSSAVDLREPPHFNMSKRQQRNKALLDKVNMGESHDWSGFWQLLTTCLAERHEAAPVHSLQEIELLASRFPKNIRLYTLSALGELQAGVCVYDTGLVAHSQYAASTPLARSRYYLTLLYDFLMRDVFSERRYFDFGTSNEDGGRVLNTGLLNQKYSMGATGVAYETFSLDL